MIFYYPADGQPKKAVSADDTRPTACLRRMASLRAATVRERMVVTPEPPLAYARGSYTPLVPPAQPHAWLTSRDREGADGRDTRTTACLRARLVYAARDTRTTACLAYEPRP